MNINLHIERLVLDGINIAPNVHHLLQANVSIELTQLLNKGGLAGNLIVGTVLPRLSASSIQLKGNNPVEVGKQIAQSVYGGIGHE